MSACLTARISRKPHVQISRDVLYHVTGDRGLIFLWRQWDMLCTWIE